MDNTAYWSLVTDSVANFSTSDCLQPSGPSTKPLLVQVVDKKRINQRSFRRVTSIEKTDFQLSRLDEKSEATKNRVVMVK